MYGAILGDIVGSPYEFDYNIYKGKDFPLFSQRSEFRRYGNDAGRGTGPAGYSRTG